MDMEYMRAGWMNNLSCKEAYRLICHLVRLYKRAWREGKVKEQEAYTRMVISWLINEPIFTVAALSCGRGE